MQLSNSIFYGLEMSQNDFAPLVLNDFLNEIKPKTIIEIGTYKGGLSFLLQIYSTCNNVFFITYDIKKQITHNFFVNQKIVDVFSIQEEIGNLLQHSGISVLFCDGGNKIIEFNLFSKYLKIGDFILAHDYSKNNEYFRNEIKHKFWNWCEITDDDIKETYNKYNLSKFMPEEMQKAAWTCWKKIGETNVSL